MGDLGVQISVCLSIRPSVNIYPGCLVSATPLTVLYQSFWNFACIFVIVWGCVCGLDIIVKLFFVTSSTSWTQFFLPQCIDSGYLMSATPHTILYRSFWNFARFLHGLKMCMWFGYNPCINFCHFFHFANFCHSWPQILWKWIDSGYLVSATPRTILYRSFWNFAHVFAMVWRCACGLDIILELIFVTFFILWTLSFSDLRFYESL